MNDLFSRPHAYEGKTDTSRAAAAAVRPITGESRLAVYHFIEDCGSWGATLEEIQQGTGMKDNTVRPRRKELEEMGAVVDSGKRRKNEGGRDVIVWVVV